jgi:hypothetical protein
MAELEHDLSVGVQRHSLAGHRRAQHIPADPLQPLGGRDRHASMQIEALTARERRIVPDDAHGRPNGTIRPRHAGRTATVND